ncbi:GNAT family N-acetyltransferase [Niallia taxi]|uniref:GNAT family N-acetyltransferase n=1 Tax=Niallia TaxID=2837506 RepID=UPI00203B4749|nr:GNAT family N-acetyltransferase [Niallia sp. MER 6]MCM3031560.1 GNAT family N-acetyltransferase [Niallia sp. MER 6]
MEAKLKIVPCTDANRILLKNYRLKKGQEQWTAMPLAAMEQCDTDKDRYPFLLLWDLQLAGFFVLHKGKGVMEYHSNKNAILLRAYSIEASYQGRGFAGSMLKQLPEFIKGSFPSADELILAVNEDNEAAQHVYEKAGFADRGLRAAGSAGHQLVLHKNI